MSCLRCPAPRDRHFARGLCGVCYGRALRAGELDEFETTTRSDVVLQEWKLLADRDLSQNKNIELLAPRLGMKPSALEIAIRRLKKQGRLEWKAAA